MSAGSLSDALGVGADLLAPFANRFSDNARADGGPSAVDAGVRNAGPLVVLRNWRMKDVMPLMIPVRQALEVVEFVVPFVVVLVVDVPAVRDRALLSEPTLSVQPEGALGFDGLVGALDQSGQHFAGTAFNQMGDAAGLQGCRTVRHVGAQLVGECVSVDGVCGHVKGERAGFLNKKARLRRQDGRSALCFLILKGEECFVQVQFSADRPR